jgi:hypothetical protein
MAVKIYCYKPMTNACGPHLSVKVTAGEYTFLKPGYDFFRLLKNKIELLKEDVICLFKLRK